jgi:hypothetical protein
MEDLINEANKRDNQRNVGVFNLVIIQRVWDL